MLKSLFYRYLIILLFTLLLTPSAQAQDTGLKNAPEGTYITNQGWGSLLLHSGNEEREIGAKLFNIETIGANGHSCNLTGKILSSGEVQLDNEDDKENKCIIHFKANENGIDITEDKNSASCRGFCGARAGFTSFYNRIQDICDPSNIPSAVWAYEGSRSSDEMSVIREKIAPILQNCSKTITNENEAKLHQAIALANYHAHNQKECQKALLPYQKIINASDADITEMYPGAPSDEDNWRRIAKQMRDILALCQK